MTTNGTGITRSEAEIIIGLIDVNAVQESSFPVLKKLSDAYPDLLPHALTKQIRVFEEKQKLTKQEATKQITAIVKDIYALFEKAEKIADNSGVHFYFDMNGTYGMGGRYDPAEQRWCSSSEDC